MLLAVFIIIKNSFSILYITKNTGVFCSSILFFIQKWNSGGDLKLISSSLVMRDAKVMSLKTGPRGGGGRGTLVYPRACTVPV